MDHCKRGHPYTTSNIRWIPVKGRKYRSCKICRSAQVRLRYKNDAAFRERLSKTALEFYHKKKAEKHGLAEVSR